MRPWPKPWMALATLALSLGCSRPREHATYQPAWPTPLAERAPASLWTAPVPLAPSDLAEIPGMPPPLAVPEAPEPAPAPPPELHPYHTPIPIFTASAPALRLANMTPAACRKEAQRRDLAVKSLGPAVRGIANAFRIAGPLNGIKVVSAAAPSPFGMLDCRLLLALDEITALIAPLGVREMYIGSMYRPEAKIGHRPKQRSQHSYGLAMDVISLRLEDGRYVSLEKDWHAAIGDSACGAGAVMTDPNPGSIALRNAVCAIARSHICHHVITPSANRAHRDHFHCDIKRDTKYASMR